MFNFMKLNKNDAEQKNDYYEMPVTLANNSDFLEFADHLAEVFKIYENIFFCNGDFLTIENGYTVGEVAMIQEGHRNIVNYIKSKIKESNGE